MLVTGVNQEAPLRLQVGPGLMEPLAWFCGQAAFHLDRPALGPRQIQHQIHFSSGSAAVKASLCSLGSDAEELLDHEALPAAAGHRVAQDRFPVVQSQQGVQHATVPHVHLG